MVWPKSSLNPLKVIVMIHLVTLDLAGFDGPLHPRRCRDKNRAREIGLFWIAEKVPSGIED
jgi:hypothetical protein